MSKAIGKHDNIQRFQVNMLKIAITVVTAPTKRPNEVTGGSRTWILLVGEGVLSNQQDPSALRSFGGNLQASRRTTQSQTFGFISNILEGCEHNCELCRQTTVQVTFTMYSHATFGQWVLFSKEHFNSLSNAMLVVVNSC